MTDTLDPTDLAGLVVSAKSSPRQFDKPRARMKINGTEVIGLISMSLQRNGYFQADSYDCEVDLYADPAFDFTYWASVLDATIEFEMGFQGDDGSIDWTSMFTGGFDHKKVDTILGKVTVSGRDLTSRFLDNKTKTAFVNQTSSEIISTLAAKRSLTADVTATTEKVGSYYNGDHVSVNLGQFTHAQTEWQLIEYLAKKEGFDAWVSGSALYFHPVDSDTTPPIKLVYVPPITVGNHTIMSPMAFYELTVTHNVALSKDIRTVVRSYDPAIGKSYIAKAGKAEGKDTQVFERSVVGMTAQAAQDEANRWLDALTKHEYLIDWQEPVRLSLNPRQKVQLTGTSTVADILYYVDEITYEYSFEGGLTMSARGKNHREDDQSGGLS